MWRAPRRFAGMIALLGSLGANAAGGAEGPTRHDCGTLSLYTLLHMEGREPGLGELGQRLPAIPKAGYSMKQLRDAARASGLALEGVLWKDKVLAPRGPILAFLKQGEHGHYVVIRPVGRSGKMVQIFDNDLDVKTCGFADVTAAPEWTGLILQAVRPNWAGRSAVILLIVAIGLLVRHFARSWGRGSRPRGRSAARIAADPGLTGPGGGC